MKGILEFDLRDDQNEFETAINADRYKSLIRELDQYLRSEIRYNDKLSNDTCKAFELVRDKIREELIENNISIE
jgi:hypothetical protein